MLLDPFEEKFYPPSITIQISDCLYWNDEVFGQEVERFDCFAVVVFDSTQRLRITFTRAGPGQEERLITPEPWICKQFGSIVAATECLALPE